MTTLQRSWLVLCAVAFLVTNPGCSDGGQGNETDGDSGTADDISGSIDVGTDIGMEHSADTGMDSGFDLPADSPNGSYSWQVTYDLTGSTYFIDALMDFTITVQEPYDADLNMGPGTLTLLFSDDGGEPASGSVVMVEYSMLQNFVTGVSMAKVTTDLDTSAGPDMSGVAHGVLGGGALTWDPAEVAPYCVDGEVSCTGSWCGTMGSPPEGQPFVFDNDCSKPLPLNPFVFTNGVSNFTMEAVIMSQDANQTTSLAFVGTETNRQRILAP